MVYTKLANQRGLTLTRVAHHPCFGSEPDQ